ncbi:MAG: hypothetical protein CR984_00740 [Proteobacteria bacterium]|nr:MAG: hypothetical protein CR984_00740 [Pseudomonadota bacterium]
MPVWFGGAIRFEHGYIIDHGPKRMRMKFKFGHNNTSALNLNKRPGFYKTSFDLVENRRRKTFDVTLVYLGAGRSRHQLVRNHT